MGEFVCRVADANGRVYSQVEAAGTQAEARQKLADRNAAFVGTIKFQKIVGDGTIESEFAQFD